MILKPFRMMMKSAVCILKNGLGEREYDIADLYDPAYARQSTAAEWLRDRGFDPDTIFYPENVDHRERKQYNDAAVNACLRLWIETHGHVGRVAEARLMEVAQEITASTGQPMPTLGKQMLRDDIGRSI